MAFMLKRLWPDSPGRMLRSVLHHLLRRCEAPQVLQADDLRGGKIDFAFPIAHQGIAGFHP